MDIQHILQLTINGITVSVVQDPSEKGLVEVALRKDGKFLWPHEVRHMTPLEVLRLLDDLQRR